MNVYRVVILCLFSLVIATGCQGEAEQAPQALSVPLRVASWEETEQLIASHKGKVVVLDAWSTWCTPCMAEFPGLVKLHKTYPGQVACISLNCNYTGAESPKAQRGEIEAFLVKQRASFDNLISTVPDHKLFDALQVAAVPVVRVYDRSGKLHKQFDNDENEYGEAGFSYEKHIAPLVAELIGQPATPSPEPPSGQSP
jgi:thiol-disulfide isomerase/thioredoxin